MADVEHLACGEADSLADRESLVKVERSVIGDSGGGSGGDR